MSRRQIEQLAAIREDHAAAQAAITHLEREWHRLGGMAEAPSVRLFHVQRAARDLEATYVVRLFSEFAGILHNYLNTVRPDRRLPRTAEGLINRAALHGRIPDPIRA